MICHFLGHRFIRHSPLHRVSSDVQKTVATGSPGGSIDQATYSMSKTTFVRKKEKGPSRWMRIFGRILKRSAKSPWFAPIVGLMAAADLFIGIVPTDALVVAAVYLKPKQWIRVFAFAALGSALGSVALVEVIDLYGIAAVEAIAGKGVMQSSTWSGFESYLGDYGLLAIGLISLSPLPQQPVIALAGFAHLPSLEVGAAVLIGRAAKYGVLSWMASHAPALVEKWGINEWMKVESPRR